MKNGYTKKQAADALKTCLGYITGELAPVINRISLMPVIRGIADIGEPSSFAFYLNDNAIGYKKSANPRLKKYALATCKELESRCNSLLGSIDRFKGKFTVSFHTAHSVVYDMVVQKKQVSKSYLVFELFDVNTHEPVTV